MNELDITKEGCPVAQPKFTKRPSAKTIMSFPLMLYKSTCGLISFFVCPWFPFNQAISISLSKCPMLQTIALSFIFSKCLPTTIFLFPVVVTMISPKWTTVSNLFTSNPSIAAWSAQIGSISVTITRAPAPFKEAAEPFPTSP